MAPYTLLEPTKHDVYPFIDPRQRLKNTAVGKTVLVTGAGTGIGRSIAESFAFAGAETIVVVARREEPLNSTKASIAKISPTCNVQVIAGIDVAKQEAVEKLFTEISTLPDIVVSNAGIAGALSGLSAADPTQWWKTMEVNVFGSFLVARGYIQAMRAANKKGGLIINVSSGASHVVAPGLSSYSMSKIALNVMTSYIDLEEQQEGGTGVRCVSLHPGSILGTEIVDPDLIPEQILKLLIDTLELPGGVAVYLSTPPANFLMGRFVDANWDMEALEKVKGEVEKEPTMLMSRVLGVSTVL